MGDGQRQRQRQNIETERGSIFFGVKRKGSGERKRETEREGSGARVSKGRPMSLPLSRSRRMPLLSSPRDCAMAANKSQRDSGQRLSPALIGAGLGHLRKRQRGGIWGGRRRNVLIFRRCDLTEEQQWTAHDARFCCPAICLAQPRKESNAARQRKRGAIGQMDDSPSLATQSVDRQPYWPWRKSCAPPTLLLRPTHCSTFNRFSPPHPHPSSFLPWPLLTRPPHPLQASCRK